MVPTSGDEEPSPQPDCFRTYQYPYDYVFVTLEHLVLDRGYELRYTDPELGRVIAHIEGGGIVASGLRGFLDATIKRTGEGIWVWVHMAYYDTLRNDWMDRQLKEFVDLLDERLENRYTADILDVNGEQLVQVFPEWADSLPVDVGTWRYDPRPWRPVTYSLVTGVLMVAVPLTLYLWGIYDGFPNWFYLTLFSLPPFIAAGLALRGDLERANFVIMWVGFILYLVWAFGTLLVGWYVIRLPVAYASSLMSEGIRWSEMRERVDAEKHRPPVPANPVCGRSNKCRRGTHDGPSS